MITARMTAGRRIAASLVLAGLALGVTSCGAINQQSTTDNYAPSDGIIANVANADVRNLLLVTNTEHTDARLIGSIVNDSDQDLTLTVEAASAAPVEIPVKADSVVKLEDAEYTIPDLGIAPGLHAPAVLSSGTTSVETTIPVVDGTLKEYRDFVPGGFDPSVTDHLEPVEPAPGAGHH